MREHFLSMQMGLVNVVFGLAMALLVSAWPNLSGSQAYGLYFATFVVLMHWHFGSSFVLHHFGPSLRLSRTILDSLMLFAMLGIVVEVKNPVAWFFINAAAYLLALLKYRRLPLEFLKAPLALYVRRKKQVEIAAAALCLLGGSWCWISPSQAALPCWGSFVGNLAAAYVLSDIWRLYHVEA
jgi:hypothetical protein